MWSGVLILSKRQPECWLSAEIECGGLANYRSDVAGRRWGATHAICNPRVAAPQGLGFLPVGPRVLHAPQASEIGGVGCGDAGRRGEYFASFGRDMRLRYAVLRLIAISNERRRSSIARSTSGASSK
jgi:hypothetical protein